MILIQSHSLDETTNEVIDCLLMQEIKVLRINENAEIVLLSMEANELSFVHQGAVYSSKNIKSFWHRKAVVTFEGHITSRKSYAKYRESEGNVFPTFPSTFFYFAIYGHLEILF